MRNFRLLKADEIECRISQVTAKGVGLLLYKTARTDYALLDETVGMMRWQNDYKVIDGKMYCGIAIQDNSGDWIWKWNCGTESNTEAEKGQASDAMKRAGFAWGIGTELYSAPFTWIPAEVCKIVEGKNGKLVCYDKFYVREIAYNEAQDINKLVIVNAGGKPVFEYPRQKGAQEAPQAQEAPPAKATYPAKKQTPTAQPEATTVCNSCGEPIKSQKVVDFSIKKYGVALCMDCQREYAR